MLRVDTGKLRSLERMSIEGMKVHKRLNLGGEEHLKGGLKKNNLGIKNN